MYVWYKEFFDYVNLLGMLVFSLFFDEEVVDFFEGFNVFCFKIVFFELMDIFLVRKVVSIGKFFIMFIGMVSLSDIEFVVSIVKCVGCDDIVLLKCISIYFVELVNINLIIILYMFDVF